ncbi:SDR family oxidoreductase [Aestuariivirga sp.]|uniref:SDR family oxidoreductase n=1 Tax=Aestuariivirga sp. TaxID=2650926 RepID=UPI003BADAC5F
MSETKHTLPPQHQEKQPGIEAEMTPAPDFMPRFRGADRLKGKAAVISGGDSGIGRATAVAMAREGAKIVILYLDEHEDARKTAELVAQEGSEAELFAGDLGTEPVCREAIARAVEKFGRIDVLVNNAAEQHTVNGLEELEEEQLLRTFHTNIFSMFFLTKAALPHMGKGGAIVNCASVTAYRGQSQLIDYSATKGAIVSFTRTMSQVLAPRGIRVNAVAPGPIWTPLIPASFDEERVSTHGGSTPLGRPGQPNEVASCFVFLSCEDASYMTGQVLHPNGGEMVGS